MHLDADLPTLTVESDDVSSCQCTPTPAVSLDHELELHIEDCSWQYRCAYAQWQRYGIPQDRDAALLHLHRMNVAILSRSRAVQAQRHAAFEQRLSEGVDYFQVQGAAARAAMAEVA